MQAEERRYRKSSDTHRQHVLNGTVFEIFLVYQMLDRRFLNIDFYLQNVRYLTIPSPILAQCYVPVNVNLEQLKKSCSPLFIRHP